MHKRPSRWEKPRHSQPRCGGCLRGQLRDSTAHPPGQDAHVDVVTSTNQFTGSLVQDASAKPQGRVTPALYCGGHRLSRTARVSPSLSMRHPAWPEQPQCSDSPGPHGRKPGCGSALPVRHRELFGSPCHPTRSGSVGHVCQEGVKAKCLARILCVC